ncbi:Formin Homology 2 Domain family protein [Cryptosporidium meleagridis]|uniref:Formin Homology 2 Domain family protein n=1 Tax=Cryptosporidium meleagridis TaxID=93969 RepID=A0A2P4Z4V6_9CRYT|nr:Formin Homology 2 Domain family protein [Cryptosporidium meleagridis]
MESGSENKKSPGKSIRDVDEEVLSILLKIVDLNPNSEEVLETIKISGFELDKVRNLLTKQHPELCKRGQINSAETVSSIEEANKIELTVKNEDKNDQLDKINAASTNNSESEKVVEKKDNTEIVPEKPIVKGKPPGPPPPLKSKSGLSLKSNGNVGTDSAAVSKVPGSSGKRAPPPKAPPPLKPSLKRGATSQGFGGPSGASDPEILGGLKLAEMDFGPSPPLGFEPKRLHWSVIPPNKIIGTIWEDIHIKTKEISQDAKDCNEDDPNELKFDMDSILEQFFEDKSALMQKITMDCNNNASVASAGTKKFRMVLDSKRSQNIEIALKALQLFDSNNELDLSPIKDMLGYTRQGLVGGIDSFLKGVSKERLKILLDLYPTPDEIQLLNSIKDDCEKSALPLRSSEFFMVSILGLNRFKIRAQCVLAMKAFEEEYQSCLERLIKLEDAAVNIRSSLEKGGVLRQILKLILKIGNFLNHGTNRGRSCGFRFHSIELLKNVKSNNSKSNLLKYISKVVYEHSEEMRQKVEVISQSCSEAAPIDIADVYRDMEELERSVNFIQDELNSFSTSKSDVSKEDKESKNQELCSNKDKNCDSRDNIKNELKIENSLEISVFGLKKEVEKTTEELYLEIVDTFVKNSSKKLEITKKQLNEIIVKLNELQYYAGETQTVGNNNASKQAASITTSSGEIIKRCDMFFRLVKYEFNEFQAIEKKKKERDLRKSMGIRGTKSSESLPSMKTSDHNYSLLKSSISLTEKQSQAISEFSPINEIENFSPSNNIGENSNQLLFEISNITLTSNSSTFSSSDSSFFQDQGRTKSKSGQATPTGNLDQTPLNKNRKESDVMSSSPFNLNSGYDPISSSILRYPNYFNNQGFCEHNFAEICDNSNSIYDLRIIHSDPQLCPSSSSVFLQDQNIQNVGQHKSVVNNHQPMHLKSFFDTKSSTVNIAAKVYNSQVNQSSSRSRNPKCDN